MWKGEPLENKTILIIDEGGFGDLFQWIRYAWLFKQQGAHVILQTRPGIIAIISTCPHIDQIVPQGSALPDYDVYIQLGRMHYRSNTTLQSIPIPIPYFNPDQKLIEHWQSELANDRQFKVGICWQAQTYNNASTGKPMKNDRSVPLQLLCTIASCVHISIYSLQQINGTDQIKQLPGDMGIKTFDTNFDKMHGKFMDTAAVMKNLDLIITVDTSIAHLAGALGVPTWVLLPFEADWRWFVDRDDSPWYPTMRLFRQSEAGNWNTVIEKVVQEIEALVSNVPTFNFIEQALCC